VTRPWIKEEADFAGLAPERQANIEIVSSAYASMLAGKAYLTMPVTTGRRFYEVLEAHGAADLDALLKASPDVLREEIILPNIAESVALAERVAARIGLPLVVPGVFEARRQRWSQDEYMCLWMRLITGSVREVHLCDVWEYSNGGAAEYARAILIRHRCLPDRDAPMSVFDAAGEPVAIERGAGLLSSAIADLGRRGFGTAPLRRELSRLAGLAAMLAHSDRHGYAELTAHTGPVDCWAVVDAARAVDVPAVYTLS
jgi:hypothetical protein